MNQQFVHLHTHSQYSVLDGAILIPDLIKKCQGFGMEAVALTDHGFMGGVIGFYKQCRAVGIKPLLGVEAYITEDEDNKEEGKTRDNMHMILIAKDNVGYSRLLELVSRASLNNFYYKPRIYKKSLEYLSGHVVATSACLGGILSKKSDYQLDLQGRATSVSLRPEGQVDLDFYLKTFGEDFYLEVQGWDDGTHYQPEYNKMLLGIGKSRGIPIIIAADAHYLNPEDHQLHQLLMAMQLKMKIQDYKEKSELQYGPYFYFASAEEMRQRAISLGLEEAADNTNLIANKCDVEIKLGSYSIPIYPIESEDDYEDFKKKKSNRKFSSC